MRTVITGFFGRQKTHTTTRMELPLDKQDGRKLRMKRYLMALGLAVTMVATLASCGNTDGNTNSGTNGPANGSGSGSAQTRNRRTTYDRSNAYDYLEDGRYSAVANGRVYGGRNDNMGRDLTQGARDLVRGAGDAIGDVGRGIGDAARDITGGTTGTPSWEPNPGNRSTMNY